MLRAIHQKANKVSRHKIRFIRMYSLSLYKWKHFQSNEVYTGRVRLGCLECLHPGFVVAVVIEFGLIDSRLGFVQI